MQRNNLENSNKKSQFFAPHNLLNQNESLAKHAQDLKRELDRQNTKEINTILSQYPELVNYSLNDDGQTALILATQMKYQEIIPTLLKHGADNNYYDNKALSAKDYASINFDEKLLQILEKGDEWNSYFSGIFDDLTRRIQELITMLSFTDISEKEMRLQILKMALVQLSHKDIELSDRTKLLDLYLSVNTVWKIVREDNFKEKLLNFIAVRENVLRYNAPGHDYHCQLTLTNHFCCQLVEMLDPNVSPANILLRQALTEGRKTPWMNVFLWDENLPDSPGEYFRTPENLIHLYQGIIERAIANLKAGQTNKKLIWFGTDQCSTAPLSDWDLQILSQRTPTIQKLVDYTNRLASYNASRENNLFERLSYLRNELGKGDAGYGHSGTEDNSGAEANIAVAEFADWWNELGSTINGRSLQERIKGVHNGRLGEVLNIILDPRSGDHRKTISYCIKIKGNMLDEILSNQQARIEINNITNVIDIRKSDDELNDIQSRILQELESTEPCIKANNIDIFDALCQDTIFLSVIQINPDVDYFPLRHLVGLTRIDKLSVIDIFRTYYSPEFLAKEIMAGLKQNKMIKNTYHANLIIDIIKQRPEVAMYQDSNDNNNTLLHTAILSGQPFWFVKEIINENNITVENQNRLRPIDNLVSNYKLSTELIEFLLNNFKENLTLGQWGKCLSSLLKMPDKSMLAKRIVTEIPNLIQMDANDLLLIADNQPVDKELIRLLFENNERTENSDFNRHFLKEILKQSRDDNFISFLRKEFPAQMIEAFENTIFEMLERKNNLYHKRTLINEFYAHLSLDTNEKLILSLIDVGFYDQVDMIIKKFPLIDLTKYTMNGQNVLHLLVEREFPDDNDFLQKFCRNPDIFLQTNNKDQSPLDMALSNKNVNAIKFFLNEDNWKHQPLKSLENAFFYALIYREFALLKKLMQYPALDDVANICDNSGLYPIHYLLRDKKPDEQLIKLLWPSQESLDAINKSEQNLFSTLAKDGTPESMEMLINLFGIDNCKEQFGNILQKAILNNNINVAKFIIYNLLEYVKTEDLFPIIDVLLNNNFTLGRPLLLNRQDILNYRFPSGVYPIHVISNKVNFDSELMHNLCKNDIIFKQVNRNGQTFLESACESKRHALVSFCMQHHFNKFSDTVWIRVLSILMSQSEHGMVSTILMQHQHLIGAARQQGVDLLLSHAAEFNTIPVSLLKLLFDGYQGFSQIPNGSTILDRAINKNNIALIEFFVGNYAQAFSLTQTKRSIEFLLNRHQNKTVKLLLSKKPDIATDIAFIDQFDRDLMFDAFTPDMLQAHLSKLIKNDRIPSFEAILEDYGDRLDKKVWTELLVDCFRKGQYSPIVLAIKKWPKMLDELYKHSPDLLLALAENYHYDNTSIYHANANLLKILCNHDAFFRTADYRGRTVLNIAIEKMQQNKPDLIYGLIENHVQKIDATYLTAIAECAISMRQNNIVALLKDKRPEIFSEKNPGFSKDLKRYSKELDHTSFFSHAKEKVSNFKHSVLRRDKRF